MLSDIVVQEKTIKFSGGEFAVRGLGLHAIAGLMNSGARDDIDKAVELFQGAVDADEVQLESTLSNLVTTLPSLACRVIAFAAGEPKMYAKVGELPLPIQFDAIRAIFSLTFEGADSIKNFIGALLSSLKATSETMKGLDLKQIASTGTGN